ncbi:MAG: response regulator [Elusimicrobia bacterium]|nr:response regulator [Elusimicrobiota bacterium]
MPRKIMLADDDSDNRAIAAAALTRAGFQVVQAVDGEEAVALALRELPDLILLDMSMPKLSGWDAVGRLRAQPALSGAAILAYTAHAMAGDEGRALAAGCDGYIAKPCAPRELVRLVRERLGGEGGDV